MSISSPIAKNVILQEIEGLNALLKYIDSDDAFSKAVELILNTSGKIVCSGMGKSGHVARKIAATFASTGTPAFYVHPAEASHGDLGMIGETDSLLLLSNSGETAELNDIIAYSRRFLIPTIALVRRSESTLAKASDVALIIPDVQEALTANAPSTSTTMMMVMGDALAAALMHKRGFANNDFARFHPGGKLGRGFIKTSEIMRKGKKLLPIVQPHDKMSDVLPVMSEKSLGIAIVTDANQHLLGIITDGDLRRHMSDNIILQEAKQIMTANPITIRDDSLAVEALAIMNDKNITCLVALDEKQRISGAIHIHDCLRAGIA